MKKLFQFSLLFLLISSAIAQESSSQQPLKILRIYDWKDLIAQQLPNCKIISLDGMSVLKIENTNDAPLEVLLFNITNSIIKKATTISFDMKYENVRRRIIEETNHARPGLRYIGTNYLFLPSSLTFWMHHPPYALGGDEVTNGSKIFIDGTANWEPQYFTIHNSTNQLELNLRLEGSGTFYFRPIELLGLANILAVGGRRNKAE